MKIFLTLCLLLNTIITQAVIRKEDIPALESGKQILYKENVESGPWPKIHIYQLIDATPLESLAIFLALDHQKNYLPNVIASTPIEHKTPTEVYTKYEMELPWPLSNSHYTHASDFKRVSESEYSAKWWMITSESAEAVTGSAEFKLYNGKTLMAYHSLVKPKSMLASLVKGTMIEDTLTSIEAVRVETQRVKQSDKKLLEKYKKIINDGLKGINSYQEIIQSLSSKK
ncbi:hypothetical protein [Halobacteriovorax sp.]|uniref:hypothetical protein n=1 Tax=Halobacteriovorax sp. TaxID=2020862 RepID=UPI00356969E6